MTSDAYPLRAVIEAADAGLDGVVVCRAQKPYQVLYLAERARELLTSLDAAPPPEVGEFDVVNEVPEAAGGFVLTVEDLIPPGFDADLIAMLEEVSGGGFRVDDVIRISGPEGTIRASLMSAVRQVGPFLIWSFRALASDLEASDRPPRTPSLDPLTGLSTRAGIRAALERCIERLDFLGEGFALEFLDVDDLHAVNSAFGHEVGDVVVRDVGERMRALVRGSDTVGRVGGDEFVLVWPGVRSISDVQMLHTRVSRALGEPYRIDGHEVQVTISAGALFLSANAGSDPDDLLRDADAAMRQAKERGPGSLLIVESVDRPLRPGGFVTPGELRRALRDDEFVLYAQPLVDVASGQTTGAEMLVRWYHPERGLLNPADFMMAAEVSDIIGDLGGWVIDQAVAQAAAWERVTPLDNFRVGVNVWPHQFGHADVVGQFVEALERHGTTADNFVIEIIESQELESRARAAEQIAALLDLGFRVGIDDFGSGFANMSYLRDLPVDLIKVDRALVGRYPTRREEAILQAVQSVASAIGADVVLEGVEQIAQLETARRCGVTFAQGYLVGRPTLAGLRPPRGRFPLPPMPPQNPTEEVL